MLDINFLNNVAYDGEGIMDGVKYIFKDYHYIGEVRREDGEVVARFNNKSRKWTTWDIETNYAPEADITYIMESTYIDGNLTMLECISWYSGEPNEDDTRYFSKDRRLAATY